jgi:hypothetical protein
MSPELNHLLGDVLAPIIGCIILGQFIFTALKFVLKDVIDSVTNFSGIVTALENRVRCSSHELIKLDLSITSKLGLRPDIERICRVSGREDMRKD